MPDEQNKLKAYESLFRSNYKKLCSRACRITNDMAAAEDLVQEVFVNFWNNTERQFIDTPEAYLYTAVINKALNYTTSQKRRLEINAKYLEFQPKAGNSIEQEMLDQELQQKIQQSIEALPPVCQKVFLLSRYEEMSHKEIADFLNISPNTVDNHIKKALAILRKVLLSVFITLFEIYFHFFS
ncbi:RNA polymerase sigma-70 factor [Pontibacter cellulosilyticus]|uniref:RNA polymerase sigma-70 factor n=1 Tax=Pontibacter cellulosilyticus TaxID=1720253 RepID=A0A923SK84_9BACT|nr:RNA polymerase sigma-70 factor [Pontibacter cellulosilyticus]MBC5993521.1 RNA polymerase sigma-70 factor [Pontibacter cellulosilyticus]